MAADNARQVEPALSRSRAAIELLCFDNLMSNVDEQIYYKDLESRFLHMSKGQARALGGTAEQAIGLTDAAFFSAEHAQKAYDDEQRIIRTGEPLIGMEESATFPDRPPHRLVSSKYPIRARDGAIIGTFGVSHDVTRLVEAESASRRYEGEMSAINLELRRVEHELRALFDGSPDAVVTLDRELRHVYVNPHAARLLQTPVAGLLGRSNHDVGRAVGDLDVWETTVRRVFDTGVGTEFESSLDLPSGRLHLNSRLVPLVDDDGVVTSVMIATRDMTARRLAEEALAHQAVHDPVTGLANRVLLLDRIEHAILNLEREPATIAVLFLDVDRFKLVNDSLGHAAGDELLCEVGRRLSSTARRSDTVARFGGDEFIVLCESLASDESIRALATRISAVLSEPFVIDGHSVPVSASMGIATTSDSRRTADGMVRDADAAMYLAKARSRGGFEFFDSSVREQANARFDIETGLRRALHDGEFRVFYQPVFSLVDNAVTGVEALVRWEHPERGLLLPAEFLPIAEETRLVVGIDRWVLDQACGQLAVWNQARAGKPALTMAVNVSGRQLSEPDFVDVVGATLRQHDLAPGLLCLEVTETAMLQEVTSAVVVCERLAALGVRIALDDFGTGYSSLGHLQRFPVNILKIDRSFVEGMHIGNDGSAIIAAVTGMARALGMRTVGEGIETAEQLASLQEMGCDEGQGFWLARPVAPRELRGMLGLELED